MGIPVTTLDHVLSLQLAVAWAGEEKTDPPRLGWWRTAMVDEFGGEDLMQRLAPQTWRWAVLQAVREAARRTDALARDRTADPDQLISLFRFGFEIDERLDERLVALKHQTPEPVKALPHLSIIGDWDKDKFASWLAERGDSNHTAAPSGRRLKGAPPSDLVATADRLAAALLPLHSEYPLPHFRRDA